MSSTPITLNWTPWDSTVRIPGSTATYNRCISAHIIPHDVNLYYYAVQVRHLDMGQFFQIHGYMQGENAAMAVCANLITELVTPAP